jgi:hypothetical protein
MQAALRLQAAILPGKRIEITAPELPERGTVELVIFLPDMADKAPQETPDASAAHNRYPDALNDEYNALIQTQWQRALTAQEATRLEELKAQINAYDGAADSDSVWERSLTRIREQLAEIRREVEALPDAL